jgi:hypothetical protein
MDNTLKNKLLFTTNIIPYFFFLYIPSLFFLCSRLLSFLPSPTQHTSDKVRENGGHHDLKPRVLPDAWAR